MTVLQDSSIKTIECEYLFDGSYPYSGLLLIIYVYGIDRFTIPIDRRWGLTFRRNGAILPIVSRWDGDERPFARPSGVISDSWLTRLIEDEMGLTNEPPDLLPGTLDMLVLRSLVRGPLHGYGIAERLRQVSEEVLQVGESSLYPALQRLLLNGWVKAEWGASDNNRRARYYTLTAAGRRQLNSEREEFNRLIVAIQRVLEMG
jgi:PadR family transcriptional regulator